MVLSDCEIRNLVQEKKIIEPFHEKQLQAVSYDITSGSVVVVYQRLQQPLDLRDKDQIKYATEKITISPQSGYPIKPGEYILIKTGEKFNIPANLTAHVRPRTTFNRFGLTLSDQHMNPGFRGHLFLGLYNATPNIINIVPGLTIGQMVFEKVQGEISQDKLYDQKPDAKYQDEDDFIVPRLDDLTDAEQKKVNAIVDKLMGK